MTLQDCSTQLAGDWRMKRLGGYEAGKTQSVLECIRLEICGLLKGLLSKL